MSQFLYFIPNATRTTAIPPELSYAFPGNPATREATKGPNGQPGLTLSMDSENLGFYEDKQSWFPHPMAEGVFVGVYNDSKPKPDDLKKENLLDGKLIALDDGQKWLVPLIRKWTTAPNDEDCGYAPILPVGVSHDPEALAAGKLQLSWGETAGTYRHLEVLAVEYAEFMSGQNDESAFVDPQVLFESAVTVIAENYRVSWVEMYLLGAFTSSKTSQSVLNYSCMDWENLDKWLASKKNDDIPPSADDGLSSKPGQKEKPGQATSPPMQTTSP